MWIFIDLGILKPIAALNIAVCNASPVVLSSCTPAPPALLLQRVRGRTEAASGRRDQERHWV